MVDRIVKTEGPERPTENVTIINERSRGSGGMIMGVIVLALIAAVAFWALSGRHAKSTSSDANVAAAADKVGAAAQKIGTAAEHAVKKID